MSRKTNRFKSVAIPAILSMIIAGADASGAFAQPLGPDEALSANPQQADLPVAPDSILREAASPVAVPGTAGGGEPAGSLSELVARIDAGPDLSEQMQCLAGAIYFESRGEPLAGQLAVARVVINRAGSGSFPQSYCGVVHQRGQFSFIRNGAMPQINAGSPAWQRAKAIARIAHEGLWQSEAGEALYFHNRQVSPRWSRSKTALAAISRHVFYR